MKATGIPWWTVGLVVVAALFFVLLQDMGFTWLMLMVIVSGAAAMLIWSGRLVPGLLLAFIASSPISISKHIYSPPGAFTLPISVYLSDIVFFALLLVWGWRMIFIERSRPYWSPHYKWVMLLLLWMSVSTLWSDNFSHTFTSIFNYLRITVMMIVLADVVKDRATLKYVVAGAILVVCANVAMSLLQTLSNSHFQLQGIKTGYEATRLQYGGAGGIEVYRPSGLTLHPNILASLMVFVLPPLFSYLLLFRQHWRTRVWRLMFVVSVSAALALAITLSRGGWVSAVGASMFVILLLYRVRLLPGRALFLLGLGATVAAALLVAVYPAVLLRISQPDHRSGESRLLLIDQAVMIIEDAPVLGVGAGEYATHAQLVTPKSFAPLADEFVDTLKSGVVHNKYLVVCAELGVIGLAIFMAMVIHFVRMPYLCRAWRDPWLFSLSVGLSATIVGHLFFFLVDHFYSEVSMQLLWLIFGLLVAVERINDQSRGSLTPTAPR